MSRLRVVPLVEGHGEVEAVRDLLTRIWTELLDGEYVKVLSPLRVPRTRMVSHGGLSGYLELAGLKLKEVEDSTAGLVLVLLDADEDMPCVLAPRLRQVLSESHPHLDVEVVVANPEYETWFVAAAESLERYLDLSGGPSPPEEPEEAGLKKAWIEQRFRGTRYSETVDQPRLTAAMDLSLARRRSPSFDKLCRVLEARL